VIRPRCSRQSRAHDEKCGQIDARDSQERVDGGCRPRNQSNSTDLSGSSENVHNIYSSLACYDQPELRTDTAKVHWSTRGGRSVVVLIMLRYSVELEEQRLLLLDSVEEPGGYS
jgi:hypothetical protein